jgi:hypothetical protein
VEVRLTVFWNPQAYAWGSARVRKSPSEDGDGGWKDVAKPLARALGGSAIVNPGRGSGETEFDYSSDGFKKRIYFNSRMEIVQDQGRFCGTVSGVNAWRKWSGRGLWRMMQRRLVGKTRTKGTERFGLWL